MNEHIDLMDAWDDSDIGIGCLVAYKYPEQFEAIVDKRQKGWDEWVETENPDEAEQKRELAAILKAMNRDINKMYLREWSRRYSREQMQTMAYMMADMDYQAHIKIGNEQFLVFDLMNAWNETHPDETEVYIVGFEK